MNDPLSNTGPMRLGAYRIEGSLGQGGMGEVFLAWDERLERHVAIKRIRTDKTLEKSRRARFRREARAVARLSHPAIVQIYDVLDTDDGECIVMERVEGESLTELLARGEVNLPLAVRLAGEIADGLGEAHGKGLVHRDLKPSNVIVTPSGHAKILDFGLARALWRDGGGEESAATLTESGALVGTVHAMSPEQAGGRPVDHRSDLFALGGLLYEMVTGRAAFRGPNLLDSLRRVMTEEPAPIPELAPEAPAELVALIGRLLAKDPAHRPQNARLVTVELEHIAALPTPPLRLPTTAGGPEPGTGGPRAPAQDPVGLGDLPTVSGLHAGTGAGVSSALRLLVLTSLVDSTKLVESLGESRAFDVWARHDRAARDLLARFGGLEIDKRDGFFLLFERPADAVAYALAYHRELARLSRELGVELAARVGIHLGEVYLRRNLPEDVSRGAKPLEVEGLAKPTAVRLMSLAGSRQTLLSRGAFDLARRAATSGELADPELRWLDHGSYVFPGAEEPLEVCEVGVEGFAPLREPADSAQAKRVLAAGDELTLGWRPAAGQAIPWRPNWALVDRVGEGGFGEVWLAEHKSGEKRVFKFCFEAERLRALKREVTFFRLLKEALGHRDDIARILDWNFDEAPYFLEAEYTEGGSLVEWAEQQGGIGEVPLETRLELVAEVAEALAAAHSVGILHKDVKPENVLITTDREGRPRARLTDFGIGLLADRDALGLPGITVLGFTETAMPTDSATGGTVRYMAPELLEGKPATIQADVYSLGVMLYQMVVGDFSRTLAPGWRRDVGDELLAEDIAGLVDGSPERRPGSSLEVAARLRNLEERRATCEAERRARAEAEAARIALERAHRRRRLTAAGAAAATVVLLVVSLLALQAIDARREAVRRRGQAEDLIGFMLGDLRKKLNAVGRLEILNDVGDKALDYFASVPEIDLTDSEIFRRSDALRQIGLVRIAEGRPEAAMTAFLESLALAQKLVDKNPHNVEWLEGLAVRHFWVGKVLWDQGDLEGALERFRTQLEIARRLVDGDQDNLELQLNAALAYSNIGFVQKARGDLEGALEAFRSTLMVKQKLAERSPEDTGKQLSLANQYNLVGEVLFELGNLVEAMEYLNADQAIAKAWVARDPTNTVWLQQLGQSHNFVGRVLEVIGDEDGAWEHFQAHLMIARNLVDIDPTQTDWQRHLAIASRRIGLHLKTQQQLNRALEHVEQGLKISKTLAAKDPTKTEWQRDLAIAQLSVGEVLEARGDLEGARRQAQAALALLEPLVEKNPKDRQSHLRLGESFILLARALTGLAEPRAAVEAWQRATDVLGPFARGSRDVHFLEPLAQALLHLDRGEDAEPILRELRALRQQSVHLPRSKPRLF